MSTTSDATRLTAPDGSPLWVPGDAHLSDDQVERLRTTGRSIAVDGDIDITWAFWKPQREARQAVYSGDYDIVGFVGGYRSGKSVTGARTAIEVCLVDAFSPARVLAMGKTYAEAKKTTYPVLFEELPGDNLDPFLGDGDPESSPIVRSWNKQDGILTLINGSVIILASADKPNRYDGGKFSFAWLDEADHYDTLNGVRKTIGERMDYKPIGPQVQLWTTTGNGFGTGYDILERQVDPAEDDDVPIGINAKLVTASSLNNPFLSVDDRDRLKRVHGGTGRESQALHGSFEAETGRVYSEFSRQTHVRSRSDVDLVDDWRIFGYDHGWEDERVVLEIGETQTGQFVVVDEFYRSQSHIEDVVGGPSHDKYWLQDKPKGTVYCEHEPAHIQKFRRAGYNAGKAKKDVDAGIEDVRYRLRADAEDRYGLLVLSRCENTIQEFLGYTTEDVGASDAEDHALDALRYAIHTHLTRGSSGSTGSSAVDKA